MGTNLRAQQPLSYPDQVFTCPGVAAGIPVKIGFVKETGKLSLKVAADTANGTFSKKEDAEKFLLEKIRLLLLKNCPAIAPGEYDVKAEVLAREAANYFLNNGITKVDALKLADNKELRLYSARGSYYLSLVNPLNGNTSDLLKKENGEYTFDIPGMNREKLILDKITELLNKHTEALKTPKIYLLQNNKLYIRNPVREDSTSITYAAADSNYIKKIKGGKADAAALAGSNQPVMFLIKTGGTTEEAKPEAEKPAEEKPAATKPAAKESLLAEDSISCKPDSSFTLQAFTYPKAAADSFKLKAFTKMKESKEKVYSLQVMEAAFISDVEKNYAPGCTNAEVKKDIAKFLKDVKKEIARKAETEKEKEELAKKNKELEEHSKALESTIENLGAEKGYAVRLVARSSIPVHPSTRCGGSKQNTESLTEKTLVVDSVRLIVQYNCIYEVDISGTIDGERVQTLYNDNYGLSLEAIREKRGRQKLIFRYKDACYEIGYQDIFLMYPGSAGISKELRDLDYTFRPGLKKDTSVLVEQRRLLDYVSASAFLDLQAFNADNPNKNIATELYFNYHINPYNIYRGFGILKNAYLPLTLGFNLFKQGEGMPTFRNPVVDTMRTDPNVPRSDTIAYQYYFKNLDLLKYSFMQVRPMLNLLALDHKKTRLMLEINGGFLLMGSNAQLTDPAKGEDSIYSKPVYSYSWLLESRIRLAPRPRYGLDLHVIYNFGLRPFSTDMKSTTGEHSISELGRANMLKTNKDDFILGELNFYFNPLQPRSNTDKGGLYFKLSWYKSVHYSDGHFMFLVGYSTDIKNFFR